MNQTNLRFPENFVWGASTSSYQIEGGITNDWSEWEQSPARREALSRQKRGPLSDYESGLGVNSWEQLEADIACLKKLGVNAYRFSIEWARVEPKEGEFDQAVLEKYAHFVRRLKEENIEPFVTLWHWPSPLWMRDEGGWESKHSVAYFARYVAKVVRACDGVLFWGILNEPNVYAAHGYLQADWPPLKKSFWSYLRVSKRLRHAHRAAYLLIKEIHSDLQVGSTNHYIHFEAGPGIINKMLRGIIDWWWNHYFFNGIRDFQDYIGINYYRRQVVNNGLEEKIEGPLSDMGWELYPRGLYHAVKDAARYGKPIYVTEHGLADEKDQYRAWYIKESLKALHEAIAEGVPVKGYLHWSLLDNFEWAHGFTKKFGLFWVNRQTWERTARPSAAVYAEIIKNNSV